jgi:hypothetical protein
MIRCTHLLVDSAALERQREVGREVYKHLAPLEPGDHPVWLCFCLRITVLTQLEQV